MKPQITSTGVVEARNVEDAVGLKIEAEPARRTHWERQLVSTWGKGNRGEWSHGICKGCIQEIDSSPTCVAVAGSPIVIPSTVCEPCMELVRLHYSSENLEEIISATPKWDERCPERLKPVILNQIRPKTIDWQAFAKANDWTPAESKGMALMGDQGSGKTAALWSIFRKLEQSGTAPILLGSLEMGRILGEAARDIKAVSWMHRCKVLMIDDLGKERASPGVASLFWEVLNERYNKNLPIIVSSRFTGEEFERRFGEEHLGQDIRRRMNELCRPVKFTTQ
jgi:DNA replication protein DnaC